jgi:hypothetical protein
VTSPLEVQLQLDDKQAGLISAAVNREQLARSIRSQSQAGNRYALAQPGDVKTPSAAKLAVLENTWTPVLRILPKPPAVQLPTQLGPFTRLHPVTEPDSSDTNVCRISRGTSACRGERCRPRLA